MTMRLLALAAALVGAMAPALALAEGCDRDRRAQMSCAEGQSWDVAAGRCVIVGS